MQERTFRRSTMHDRLVGGTGGLICLQQPSALRSCGQNELLAHKVVTTPRRPNYFQLPSLNLSKRAMPDGDKPSTHADEINRKTGSQTARDVRKIAMARDSIVNSLRARMVHSSSHSEQGTDAPAGGGGAVRLASGAQTAR